MSMRTITVGLVVAFSAVVIFGFGQTEGKPMALGGKSKAEAEITKKKFPWLLAGGIVAVGVVAAVLLFKKKKNTANPTNPAAEDTGTIQIASTPPGAKIYLDGKDMWIETNTSIRGVAPGEHAVRLVLIRYEEYEQCVTVLTGQTAEIAATLTAVPLQEPVMVRLPGGTFLMGSESVEAMVDEKPVHQVTLSSFEIGKYEVTQAEWISVMGTNPSYFKGARLPVDNLTWPDVQAYIGKLNDATGKRYRLPTEAEWEYACRAGTTGDRYGNLEAIAWHFGNSQSLTHEVGGKAPNAFGLFDMLGNVLEWCADCYTKDGYLPGPVVNPRGERDCNELIANSHHNVRGGSWFQLAVASRASHRNPHLPAHYDCQPGFRLARD